MCKVSVLICTYNPDLNKFMATVQSVISQKDIAYEIIIGDDGSHNNYQKEISEYLLKHDIHNFRCIAHTENLGTVNNMLSLYREAKGEYAFGTSPGDLLYDEYVLHDLYEFATKEKVNICFGNPVYYSNYNGDLKIHKILTPIIPWVYSPKYYNKRLACIAFFMGQQIVGATYFRKVDITIKCMEVFSKRVKYLEDQSTSKKFLLDGESIYYFNRNVVWYEYGTGVSTGKSNTWKELLRKDSAEINEILKSSYNLNGFIEVLVAYSLISGRVSKLFRYPHLVILYKSINAILKIISMIRKGFFCVPNTDNLEKMLSLRK